MYHSVSRDAHPEDQPFTVRPEVFAHHVQALHEWGAHTMTVTEYAAFLRHGRPPAPRTVLITVDDGYANTSEVLAPLLTDAGFTATMFVSTGMVGGVVRGSPMISWNQVCELHAQGFEIGSHGHRHIALDILRLDDARRDMAVSRDILEKALGAPVTSIAYPHGYWTRRLARAAEDLGYLAACAAKRSLSHPADDLYALSRTVVGARMSADDVLEAVEGRTTVVRTSPRTVPRAVWRSGRWLAAAAHEHAVPTAVGQARVRLGAGAPAGSRSGAVPGTPGANRPSPRFPQ
jgi:peptidoglycan/xylan/chitin deacetylase (PgdA/CDA1 family)